MKNLKLLFLAIAILLALITSNRRSKFANTDNWIVTDLLSGDRFIVKRGYKKLKVKLCGISASEGSKDYLRSLLAQGNGSVVLEKVSRQQNMIIAEVFMQIKPDQEIHLNTEMLMAGKATLSNHKICPNAEYFEMAAEMEK